jgi:hypothetical protein
MDRLFDDVADRLHCRGPRIFLSGTYQLCSPIYVRRRTNHSLEPPLSQHERMINPRISIQIKCFDQAGAERRNLRMHQFQESQPEKEQERSENQPYFNYQLSAVVVLYM